MRLRRGRSQALCPSKRYALVPCFLADANKTVLDHLVEMHHVYLTGLNRRALHAFDLLHRELRQRSSRNLRMVFDSLESFLSAEGSASDAAKELDVPAVRAAISGCRELQRLAEQGAIDELRVRHHLLNGTCRGF
ncbi:MAG: hypothetical protein ABI895_01510 [Deltaproteobacteria bacterium]